MPPPSALVAAAGAMDVGCNLRDLVTPEPIELGDLSGQRVAIDVFLNAYQFITSMTGDDGKPLSYEGRPVAHLMGFLDSPRLRSTLPRWSRRRRKCSDSWA